MAGKAGLRGISIFTVNMPTAAIITFILIIFIGLKNLVLIRFLIRTPGHVNWKKRWPD